MACKSSGRNLVSSVVESGQIESADGGEERLKRRTENGRHSGYFRAACSHIAAGLLLSKRVD